MLGFIKPILILRYAYLFYGLCILSLVYVNFFGVGHVKRWIDFHLFFIQPSELTKLSLILFLAKYFNDFPSKLNKLIYYIIPFFAVVIPTLVVMNQPDLGTGFMIFLLGVTIIFYYWVTLENCLFNIIYNVSTDTNFMATIIRISKT